jgi:TorA maturation chaperone TorD
MSNILNSQGVSFVQDEFDAVFYDLNSDPVPTTASFYEEERDDGKKRLMMVDFVLKSKYRRDKENFTDLEDDIGFIFSFLRYLVNDEADGDSKAGELAEDVFGKVLNEFVDDFIENVYMHENSAFYQEVAVVLKAFIEFERVYLGVKKPKEKVKTKKDKKLNISDEEAARRLANKKKKGEAIVECDLEEGGDVEDEI